MVGMTVVCSIGQDDFRTVFAYSTYYGKLASLVNIEKAIRSSDLGMAPNNDGKVIRLQIPSMSGDQRQKMVTRIKKMGEDAKVSCRNIRRDGNKHFELGEKDKTMTEDECTNGKTEVQGILKKYEDKVGEFADKKTKEILEQ